MAASKEDSIAFLYGLINKSLRITTTDDRIFYGEFRCIDPVSRHTSSSPCIALHNAANQLTDSSSISSLSFHSGV
jgi:hypothetical protein